MESAGFSISAPGEPFPSLLSSVQLHRWNSRREETVGVPHLGYDNFSCLVQGSLQGHILTLAKLQWKINVLSLANFPVGAFEPFPSTAGCICAGKVDIMPVWFFHRFLRMHVGSNLILQLQVNAEGGRVYGITGSSASRWFD